MAQRTEGRDTISPDGFSVVESLENELQVEYGFYFNDSKRTIRSIQFYELSFMKKRYVSSLLPLFVFEFAASTRYARQSVHSLFASVSPSGPLEWQYDIEREMASPFYALWLFATRFYSRNPIVWLFRQYVAVDVISKWLRADLLISRLQNSVSTRVGWNMFVSPRTNARVCPRSQMNDSICQRDTLMR